MTEAPTHSIPGSAAPLPAVGSRSGEPGKRVRRGGSAEAAEAYKRTRRRKPE